MRLTLSLYDVAVQVVVGIAVHLLVGGEPTFIAITSKLGFVVPFCLIVLSGWREIMARRSTKVVA